MIIGLKDYIIITCKNCSYFLTCQFTKKVFPPYLPISKLKEMGHNNNNIIQNSCIFLNSVSTIFPVK